jgi:hypothetical protein
MDPTDLACGSIQVAPHRLVESDDQPPELATAAVAVLIEALAKVAAVPPGVTGLYREAHVRPGEVEVDRLAVGEAERVLAQRRRQPDSFERGQQVVLEPAVGGPVEPVTSLEPAFHGRHTILASAAVTFQVGRGTGGIHEAEMPGVFCRALEPELIERGRHSEQRAQRCRDTQPIVSNHDVRVVVPT